MKETKVKKRNISVYLTLDIYDKLMEKHKTSYIPVSKLVELALNKEYNFTKNEAKHPDIKTESIPINTSKETLDEIANDLLSRESEIVRKIDRKIEAEYNNICTGRMRIVPFLKNSKGSRFAIVDHNNRTIDNAQGYGFKTEETAINRMNYLLR